MNAAQQHGKAADHEEKHDDKGNGSDKGQSIVIHVVNEDNGDQFDLHAGKGTPVGTLIERIYEKIKVTRQSDDRLRCEGSGEDVFPSVNLHLGDYLESGHCAGLVWLFAGGTGGARW